MNAAKAKAAKPTQKNTRARSAGFSVIIANYNYARHVDAAIASVLAQEYPPQHFEVIVIDDGSTDGSVEVIKRYEADERVRIILQSNQGQAAAFFAGLRLARHDWICFLDSDDYFKPGKLASLNRFIQQSGENCQFICHDVDALDEARQVAQSWFARQKITASSLTVNQAKGGYPFANPCGQVYRKELLAAIAPCLAVADWKRGADNPLTWGGLFLAGRVDYLHETLAVYRIHADNYFLAFTPQGLQPKVNWLARWPKLLDFLSRLNQSSASRFAAAGDRDGLLSRLRKYVQFWEEQLSPPSDASAPLVSFVTVCKNRLHHLEQTLPAMLGQSGSEVIVVDYGCPRGTAAWVRATHPAARLVEVADDPVFCVARARNLGAAQARGKWICFIDADVVLNGDLGVWARGQADAPHYYLAMDSGSFSTQGTMICRKCDFEKAGGYDEAFRGWGGEDGELYERFDQAGLTRKPLPANALSAIEHGDDERQLGEEAGLANREIALKVIRLYRLVKSDIAKIVGQTADLKSRTALMTHLKEQVNRHAHAGGAREHRIEFVVSGGLDPVRRANLERRLVYVLKPEPGAESPKTEPPKTALPEQAPSAPAVRTAGGKSGLGVAVLIENESFDFGKFSFIRLIVHGLTERGHRVSVVKIGSALPARTDMGILHVTTTWLKPELSGALPDIPVMNRSVTDISKRSISRMLLDRQDDYAGAVIVKSNANYGGASEARYARQEAGFRRIPYRIFDSLRGVPDEVWSDDALVVERFTPEIRDGKYCLRKWVFLGDRNLHLMDLSTDPIVKAGTSGSEELPEQIPGVLCERRAALGFDYGKFDYVIHQGQVILIDTNSTPGFSRQTAKLEGYAATLSGGVETWFETMRGHDGH